MNLALMQPSFLPWAGFLALVDEADLFVLLTDVEAEPKSWQTRNRVQDRDGRVHWLTVPTHTHRHGLLSDVTIDNSQRWQPKHLGLIHSCYSKTPYYHLLEPVINLIGHHHERLIDLTTALTRTLCGIIGIDTPIETAPPTLDITRIGRITELCTRYHADVLLNTIGAREALNTDQLPNGTPIIYRNYQPPVEAGHLSIIDCLARHGPNTLSIIRR